MPAVVFSQLANNDPNVFRVNLFAILRANTHFLHDDQLTGDLQFLRDIIGGLGPRALATGHYFHSICQAMHDTSYRSTYAEEDRIIAALEQVGVAELADLMSSYLDLARKTKPEDCAIDPENSEKLLDDYLQSQINDFQTSYDALRFAVDWAHIIQRLCDAGHCVLKPQDDYDAYWMGRIMASDEYRSKSQDPIDDTGQINRHFSNWQRQALRRKGIVWQFTFWRAPVIELDQHDYVYGYTNRGLVRMSTGRGLQKRLFIKTWPALETLIDMHLHDMPVDGSDTAEPEVARFGAALATFTTLQNQTRSLSPLLEVLMAFHPKTAWLLGVFRGNLGLSNSSLARAFAVMCSLALMAAAIWWSQDMPARITGLSQARSTSVASLVTYGFIVILGVAICGAFWRLIYFAGAVTGTVQRARGTNTMLSTNWPDTGHRNIIIKAMDWWHRR